MPSTFGPFSFKVFVPIRVGLIVKSSEEQSWFGIYILYRVQILAEPYLGTALSLGRCCTRAPDLDAQSRLEKKQAVDRLLSPLKYQRD